MNSYTKMGDTPFMPVPPSIVTPLEDTIRREFRQRIDELCAKEIAAAQERVSKRVPEVVAGIALDLMKCMSMERMGTDLRIIVKIPEPQA
jgi:hypothetical protein